MCERRSLRTVYRELVLWNDGDGIAKRSAILEAHALQARKEFGKELLMLRTLKILSALS